MGTATYPSDTSCPRMDSLTSRIRSRSLSQVWPKVSRSCGHLRQWRCPRRIYPKCRKTIASSRARGARASNRTVAPEDSETTFYNTALTCITVLDPQEPVDSPRVKSECGAMAMASVHYAFDQFEILATSRRIGWLKFGTTTVPCSVANPQNVSTSAFMPATTAGYCRKKNNSLRPACYKRQI